MAKYKGRPGGELRTFKGKYCMDINSDIQDKVEDDNDYYNFLRKDKSVHTEHPIDYRNYDEILLETFENANEKSAKIRINALTEMCNQLQQHHIPKFLNKYFSTIVKIVESIFQRNNGAEVKWIARIIALCYVQLSNETKFLMRFRPMVINAFDNRTFTPLVKSDLCKTIAVLIFLNKNGSKIVYNIMLKLEEIFTAKTFVRAYYNSAISARSGFIEDIEFVIASLEAWTFLYTLTDSDTKPVGDTFARNLVSLLNCSCCNLRISCAKTIAVICGSGLTDAKEYVDSNLLKIIGDISMIRKVDKMKSTILFYLKSGSIPRREVRIGKSILVVDTWSLNIQYDMLCNVFGANNIPKILRKNIFLFNLLKNINSPEDQVKKTSI